jgi:cytochrome P450
LRGPNGSKMLIPVLVGVATALYLLWTLLCKRAEHRKLGIPGPPAYPIVGSLPELLRNKHRYFDYQLENQKKYGKMIVIVGHGIWNQPRFVQVHDPELVKHFLQTNFKNYIRGTSNMRFHKLFGTGIFVANGHSWKKQRQTARPLFTPNSLQGVHHVFVERAQKVIQIFKEAQDKGHPIDIQDVFMRYTLDSIGEVGFGYNIDSLSHPVPFSQAFDRAQATIEENNRNPFLRYLPDKEFEADVALMRDFTNKIINKRRAEGGFESRTDMLSRFMLIKDPETNQTLSDKELTDILLNFFIAGRDTTAILLTWTFYVLAQNPDVSAKVLAEIEQVLGNRPPEYEDVKELKYLRKVLDETLRLYPPVPFDGRQAVNDDVLPNGQFIPAGTTLIYAPYILGRMEEYWEEPLKFDPDRWDKPLKHPFQFVSFHAGPQTCLGRPLAYQEATTMAVLLLQNFSLRLVPDHPVKPVKKIVMPSLHGVKMTVHPKEGVKSS